MHDGLEGVYKMENVVLGAHHNLIFFVFFIFSFTGKLVCSNIKDRMNYIHVQLEKKMKAPYLNPDI